MVRIPSHGPPTHPGTMLVEEFLKPLGMSQVELADRIGVSFPRVNELVHGKRGMTPDTALRLERRFSTMPRAHRPPRRSGRSGGSRPSRPRVRTEDRPSSCAPALPSLLPRASASLHAIVRVPISDAPLQRCSLPAAAAAALHPHRHGALCAWRLAVRDRYQLLSGLLTGFHFRFAILHFQLSFGRLPAARPCRTGTPSMSEQR